MRKIWKKVFALCLATLMLTALCGCNALDDLRAAQGILQDDGSIAWNGVVYKALPESELLSPVLDYSTAVNVTGPDVPVLASVFDAQLSAIPTKDRKLLAYTDSYGLTVYYCAEADYDNMVKRLTGEFVPELMCFFYSAMEDEEYVTKHYKLTDAQIGAMTAVVSSMEPKLVSGNELPKADAIVPIYECSADLLLQRNAVSLTKTGEQYCLELYRDGEIYLYLVPASQNPVMDELFKAYQDALWEGMGIE